MLKICTQRICFIDSINNAIYITLQRRRIGLLLGTTRLSPPPSNFCWKNMTSITTLHSEDLPSEGNELFPLKRLVEEVADHCVGGFMLGVDLFSFHPVDNQEVSGIYMPCAFT